VATLCPATALCGRVPAPKQRDSRRRDQVRRIDRDRSRMVGMAARRHDPFILLSMLSMKEEVGGLRACALSE
jgi:hypothetical protein